MRTIKPFTFSFKSEAIWLMMFPFVSMAVGLLIMLVVLVVRWLR